MIRILVMFMVEIILGKCRRVFFCVFIFLFYVIGIDIYLFYIGSGIEILFKGRLVGFGF